MAIELEKVRLFITNAGFVIGECQAVDEQGFVILNHPLRLIPLADGKMSIASIFIKEDWCTFNRNNVMEINIPEGLLDLYTEYEQKIHCSIILPDKKGIII